MILRHTKIWDHWSNTLQNIFKYTFSFKRHNPVTQGRNYWLHFRYKETIFKSHLAVIKHASVFLPWEPHENSMKRQKDRTLKDELPRSVGAQYATGDQWRNNSRKNEETDLSKNSTQLWMWLVMEVKSDAVKSNIAWVKANWKWSNRRWKEWTSTI